MKNTFKFLLAGLIVSTSLYAASASALELDLVGGLNVDNPKWYSTTSTHTNSSGTTFAGGIFVSTEAFPGFSLESGALYLPRKNTVTIGSTETQTTAPYFQIPILLRFDALPILSIAAGPYMAFAAGDVHVESTVSGVKTESDMKFGGANLSANDFGVLGSARAKIPVAPFIHILGDLRYVLGLKDVNVTDTTEIHYRDVQILAGIGLEL